MSGPLLTNETLDSRPECRETSNRAGIQRRCVRTARLSRRSPS
jgi:hypothetical protein